MLDQQAIIKQIDDVLSSSRSLNDHVEAVAAFASIVSALRRLSPPGSSFANAASQYEEQLGRVNYLSVGGAIEAASGVLQALRREYQSGYLESVVELIHADVFADFLDMAHYLLEQGYKDPAAVVAGSVLEAHLRKLCDKHHIPALKADGTSLATETLNADLRAAGAYNLLDQKNVTAWLDLRNTAAHGKYTEYAKEQVALMLDGVRNFISRIPA